jgi:hypothetical protein
VASQSGAAAASASSAARTASSASSSRFTSATRASTCVESVRCRPPGFTSPSSFSRATSKSKITRSAPAATSRERNSLSTLKSNPSSSNARPRQYFQSSRPRTASAACRSVRFSVNCNTVTTASCAGLIPGAPRTPYTQAKSSSAHQAPSSSRTRIAKLPLRNAFFTTRAVSAGTPGHGFGCIDMTNPILRPTRQQGRHNTTAAQTIMNQAGRTAHNHSSVSTQ